MNLEIDLSIEQTIASDFLDEDRFVRRVVFGGQAGGGKSFLIALWQVQRRLMYPGTRGYVARTVLKDLKASWLITFFDVCREFKVEYSYNEQNSTIKFPNGSTISLLEVKYKPSDPDFHELGSTEYTDGAIEEGINIHKRAAEILLSRTRYKHDVYNLTPKQLITCNPGDGWIKDNVIIPHFEGRETKKTRFVRATLESNPNQNFVKGYKETLESLDDPFDRARLLHGDWFAVRQTGGEFYKEFKQENHINEEIQYNSELPLHISFDENVNPYITATIWQAEGKNARQIDEVCLEHPRNTLEALCREIDSRYYSHVNGLFIYGDATSKKQDTKIEKGTNFFSIAAKHLTKFKPRIRVPSKNPGLVVRGNFINAIFRENFDDIEISVSDTCKHSIDDFLLVKEDSDGTKKKEKTRDPETNVSYEKYGHTSDANDYFITEYFINSFRTYIDGPKKRARHIQQMKSKNTY